MLMVALTPQHLEQPSPNHTILTAENSLSALRKQIIYFLLQKKISW